LLTGEANLAHDVEVKSNAFSSREEELIFALTVKRTLKLFLKGYYLSSQVDK
jgi:hypothetical protein